MMTWLEALVLGLIQGLTEFLPVSSSGHLQIFSTLFGIQGEENLTFAVAVHAATVCSTIVVLRNEIWDLLKGLFRFSWNPETIYIAKIALSMIPVAIVGVFFKDYVEDGGVVIAVCGGYRFRIIGRGSCSFNYCLFVGLCLLRSSPFKDGYIFSGCFYHRSGSGLCRIAWFVPFRFHHRYGDSAGE